MLSSSFILIRAICIYIEVLKMLASNTLISLENFVKY